MYFVVWLFACWFVFDTKFVCCDCDCVFHWVLPFALCDALALALGMCYTLCCVVLCWLWMLLILSLLWLCDCAVVLLCFVLFVDIAVAVAIGMGVGVTVWCDCIVGVLWMFIGERCLQKASRKTATWGSSPSCGKRFVLFCLIVVFFLLLKGGERKRPCCMWPCMIVLIDSKRIWICNLICVSWTWFNQSTIVQGLCAQAPEDGLGDPWGMEFSHKALESNPDF